MEPNAFAELLERANTCEAAKCICPKLRTFCDEADWEQTRCLTCGNSIHKKCIEKPTEHYICKICCKSKIDSDTIAALKALSDEESNSDDEDDSSSDTSRTAGSSQNVSSSSVNLNSTRKLIFDYFPPGKKNVYTNCIKPCSILLERLNLDDLIIIKSNENSESTSYKLKKEVDENNEFNLNAKKRNERIKSETSDDSIIVKNKITDLSSPLFPKLSKKWIELLQATYDSDSEVEETNTGRGSKRRLSVSTNTSCSSIFPAKRRKNIVQMDDSPQVGSNSRNSSPLITGRKNVLHTPGTVCTRRRSIRIMSTSTNSSNKNSGSSPITTGSESDSIRRKNVRIHALENHRKSVSSISNTSDMEIDDETESSSSEIKEKSKIENNNNSQTESKKSINQTGYLIDLQELNRIKLEMKAIDVVARNHCDLFCNTLNSGSIYSAKERKIEIIKNNEKNFSSTESESDAGINNVVDNQTESNLSSTNEDEDEVSEKYFFKLKTKGLWFFFLNKSVIKISISFNHY